MKDGVTGGWRRGGGVTADKKIRRVRGVRRLGASRARCAKVSVSHHHKHDHKAQPAITTATATATANTATANTTSMYAC